MFRGNKAWFLAIFLLIPASSAAPDKADKQWLEMVEPIITTKERKEFKKSLKSSQDREAFIELFWAKRDPDLTDNENSFKKEYLARYDYVMAHFESRKVKSPESPRSRVYLLLGPPTRIENRIDYSLTGITFRSPYPNHKPELWIYEDPGYDFARKRLVVQFVPINAFGDYTALADQFVWHFLQQVKFKIIANEDLEEAPLSAVAARNFQGPVEVTSLDTRVLDESSAEDPTSIEIKTQPLPEPAASNKSETNIGATESALPSLPEEVPLTVPDPGKPAEAPAATTVEAAPTPASMPSPIATKPKSPEKRSEPVSSMTVNVPPPRPITTPLPETALPVPSPSSTTSAPAAVYDASVGNPIELVAKLGFFTQGPNQSLVLGRLGFPVNKLKFDFNENRYQARFSLNYSLVNSRGTSVLSDSFESDFSIPGSQSPYTRTIFYDREFAAILPTDRYTLKVQVLDLGKNLPSYFEALIELPRISDSGPQITELLLMDPNVNAETAKFLIEGEALSPRLTKVYEPGGRLMPVVEILNMRRNDALNSVTFKVMNGQEQVRSWDLYSEEITKTPQGSLLIHAILNLQSLPEGSYSLRFELPLASGEVLSREAGFEVRK